ncbi:MAG TPA: glycosyltransferase [Candidatus Paceibacterota bacterium]|jgi:glycosyltransferase involved in cell wall biosynthesis|nr:glycosyltransferase [Candidatus Paceibacterota bacterium]
MISIIIPTLNEEKVIEKTLASLRKLINVPYEIIISDGKSTDKTVEIAKKYADHVVEYKGQNRQTIAQGRNDGAKAARGDFLVFLDADCVIPDSNEFFSQALRNFNEKKGIIALTGNIRVLKQYETLADRLVFLYMNSFFRFANNVLHKGQAPGEFQMIRKSAFESVHGFREDLVAGEDVDMFLRLSKIGSTFFDKNLTVFHTGRRAHKIGWPRLLWMWFMNSMHVSIFNKSKSKEWTAIR